MLVVRGQINVGKMKINILTFAEAEVQTNTHTDLNEKRDFVDTRNGEKYWMAFVCLFL